MANTKHTKSVVEYVVDRITNEIIEGTLKPGDKIKTEPELAMEYAVSRNTVREAIKQLQAFGVLYIKRADGTYVTERFNDRMLDPMLYSLIFMSKDWNDFVQLRKVIDIGTLHVALADEKVRKVIPTLRKILEEMRQTKGSPDQLKKLMDLDLKFHHAIERTIRNDQIDCLTSYITRLTIPSRSNATRSLSTAMSWMRLLHCMSGS